MRCCIAALAFAPQRPLQQPAVRLDSLRLLQQHDRPAVPVSGTCFSLVAIPAFLGPCNAALLRQRVALSGLLGSAAELQ